MPVIQKSLRLQGSATDASVTFAAPGAGKYNCLSSLVAQSSAGFTLTITSGSRVMTVTYAAAGVFEKSWPDESPWIGLENTSIVIAVSAGTYHLDAEGFVTP